MSTSSGFDPTRSPAEQLLDDERADREPEEGIALCMSGGGYRAMLFHLGALWRLNEAGFLPRLERVSSVSGGSITAGVLGLNWPSLEFDANGVAGQFVPQVVEPVRALAGRTIDDIAVIGGVLGPGSVSDRIAGAYRRHLFGGATLQRLPAEGEGPRFVINATNVQTGGLWRFSRPYMGDWHVGLAKNPEVELAVAVAASSAFPPVLSPASLDLRHAEFEAVPGADLHEPPYTTDVVLSDGGVYDNLGLETAWKRYRTILVSDGGGKMKPEEEPKRDWARHSIRVIEIIDDQVRSLRKRQVISSYVDKERTGTYWGIRTHIAHYGLPDPLDAPADKTQALAETATRLKRLNADRQERLINWGYAVCDAALRRHVDPGLPRGEFPYAQGVG